MRIMHGYLRRLQRAHPEGAAAGNEDQRRRTLLCRDDRKKPPGRAAHDETVSSGNHRNGTGTLERCYKCSNPDKDKNLIKVV